MVTHDGRRKSWAAVSSPKSGPNLIRWTLAAGVVPYRSSGQECGTTGKVQGLERSSEFATSCLVDNLATRQANYRIRRADGFRRWPYRWT